MYFDSYRVCDGIGYWNVETRGFLALGGGVLSSEVSMGSWMVPVTPLCLKKRSVGRECLPIGGMIACCGSQFV